MSFIYLSFQPVFSESTLKLLLSGSNIPSKSTDMDTITRYLSGKTIHLILPI